MCLFDPAVKKLCCDRLHFILPNNPLACLLADQCMKFCDDTPSVVTPSLKNPQNLDPDYLVTSFPIETTIS